MVAFGCVAVSGGKFYDGDATVRPSGPQSVTLVLRNVEDLKTGAPPLRVDRLVRKDELPGLRTMQPPPPRETDIARILVEPAERDRTIAMSTTLTVRRGANRLIEPFTLRPRGAKPAVHRDSTMVEALITMAVVDTGICMHRADLAGKSIVPTNNFGIAGVARNLRLVAVKVGNYQDRELVSTLIRGIVYAADVGSDVINVSRTHGEHPIAEFPRGMALLQRMFAYARVARRFSGS